MNDESKYERKVIHSLDEIPAFASEDEERDWWAEHEFSNELWESLPKTTPALDELLPLPESSRRRPNWS